MMIADSGEDMKSYMIITGGRVDLYTLQGMMDRHLDSSRVIAVDRGIETCNKIGIVPDVIVGDFDSASSLTVGVYRKMARKQNSITFVDLDVHKDLTDTHAALRYAMDDGATDIYISGATGTRMDHTMANIGLLKECVDRGVNAYIEDDHNVITMINGSASISRIDGYEYVSLIPYGGCVRSVTLTGFEYTVSDYDFQIGDSRGVSNRITDANARIEMNEGYMIINYSRD